MLEKQQGAVRAEERNAPARLPVSLPGEINVATRTLHTSLNRLITSRLPLALPPHAPDSSLYATGLLHFAHIFLTFESLWTDLLRDHATPPAQSPSEDRTPSSPLLSYLLVNPYDAPSLFTSTLGAPTPPSPQLTAFLSTLRPRGLPRSPRLRHDLAYLLSVHPTDLDVMLAKYPGPGVAAFCTHIRAAVHTKPWTLLSYAWCFYMAVFSGGRWIRSGLLDTPPDFWPAHTSSTAGEAASTPADAPALHHTGLSFWHFPGPRDGEDIKAAFKAHIAAAEHLFSPDERVDVIEEAKCIFTLCAGLVAELDELVGTQMEGMQGVGVEGTEDSDAVSRASKSEKERVDAPAVMVALRSTDEAKTASPPAASFLRRPEVTGTVVALACLACVLLFKSQ
ncbi:hypothetical protein ACN47E_008937 [Coniothyrium glycines]